MLKTSLPKHINLTAALPTLHQTSCKSSFLIVFASILIHCSLFPVPCSRQLPRSLSTAHPTTFCD
ncbi:MULTISPECIES: hypothetical protein [unclassified Moorena]|uniref:hypothetical protein n=1 Tax=unclassified Moorena TaxID=2683338 RepID=UPI0013FFE25F|nr:MULTISPECIES: hypothetical protein [unclassified Moorena]NEO16647.1 hypothetical protein [Moorena sp. SIO3E8]NEQ03222.1 hypothetical protein [Moorena sp. SIO3F7]